MDPINIQNTNIYVNYLSNEIKINRLGLSCVLESRFGVNVFRGYLKGQHAEKGIVERRSKVMDKWAVVCATGAVRLADDDTAKSDSYQRQVM